MRKDNSLYPNDWFRIGSKDLKRAENLFNLGDFEDSGFNIHHAIEKYMKSYLLSRGLKLRRIHELETILNDIVAYEPSFEEFRQECLRITDYYVEELYPFTEASELSEEEIRDSIQTAKKIINKIIRLMEME